MNTAIKANVLSLSLFIGFSSIVASEIQPDNQSIAGRLENFIEKIQSADTSATPFLEEKKESIQTALDTVITDKLALQEMYKSEKFRDAIEAITMGSKEIAKKVLDQKAILYVLHQISEKDSADETTRQLLEEIKKNKDFQLYWAQQVIKDFPTTLQERCQEFIAKNPDHPFSVKVSIGAIKNAHNNPQTCMGANPEYAISSATALGFIAGAFTAMLLLSK